MKPNTVIFFLSTTIIFGLAYGVIGKYQEYQKVARRSQESDLAVLNKKKESANLRASYDAKIASSQTIEAFLLTWAEEYKQTGGKFDQVFRPLAEKHRLYIAEFSTSAVKVKSEKYEMNCDRYTVRLLGEQYSDILRFLGEMEQKVGLAEIETLTLGRNINDTALQMQLLIPRLEVSEIRNN